MSIEIIKDQIFKFLSTNEPQILAIKGEWGIGKTYTWKQFLQEANTKNINALENYSYVSLFGIKNLETLKQTIFENIINKEIIGSEPNIQTLKTNTDYLMKSLGRKAVGIIKEAPYVNSVATAIDKFSFLSIKKTLICIDDLERKGNDLDLKEILGLASLLKEQRECKIVFLLNDNEADIETYEKHKEKVIDIEIEFNPTPEECATIALQGKENHYETLKKLTTKLEIRNIRIIKKIEHLTNEALPLIKELEEEVSYNIIHSITLFCLSYFSAKTNNDIPPLEFITQSTYSIYTPDKKLNNQEIKWKTTLQAYDYNHTNEIDLIIAKAVKRGYFAKEELIKKANELNKSILASKAEGSLTSAWRMFHDSLKENQDEVTNSLYQGIKTSLMYTTPSNLSQTVSLLKELGNHERASELIDLYIHNRKDEPELFNIEKQNIFSLINDQEVIDKFNEAFKSLSKNETAEEILKRIANINGWNHNDEIILASTSTEDYYHLFKKIEGMELTYFITKCLKFGQINNATEQQREISKRATKALQKIGSESLIKKIRVQKFNIEIKDD